MKELSKADNILNEYIINNSEVSPMNEHLLTQQSFNKKVNIKLQTKRNSTKKNPLKKYCHYTSSYIRKPAHYNILINAIENNNLKKVKELLNKDVSNINLLNKNGISPLHIAVINGNLEIINFMLEKGANPNITSLNKKQTPLHYAYIFKNIKSNKIKNLLIKFKADPNIEDINNKKPKEYSLKYKESSDVDNYTSSNENDNDNLDNKIKERNYKISENIEQDSDLEKNNNKNTYSISDSEATIIQKDTKRNNLYNIEELINFDYNKYNKGKITIISRKNRKSNKKLYNKINNDIKTLSVNKNLFSSRENDINVDSLEMSKKNYNTKTNNKSLNHIKLKTKKPNKNSHPKNLKLNKDLLLKSPLMDNTLKSDNMKKEININKQYFINNEFFNNYYNDQEDLKSKLAQKIFKVPKTNEKNANSGIMSSSMLSTDIQTSKKYKSNIIINNNVAEFVYTEENNETKNLQKIKSWLESIELSSYYDNFIINNITDINKLINEYKENRDKINYQFIENVLNIHISGHIYRILCKLEIDGSFVENKISTFLLGLNVSNSENSSKKNLSKIFVQSDEYCDKCYNCCNIKKTIIEKNDLNCFLRKYRILHLYNNFYHNGFDLINFVILQMFTKFVINDEIIQKSFHIYNKKDRYLVLDALFNEVKEINIFFSTNIYNYCLFPRYENNDWGINWNEESINEENESSNDCIIF